MKQRALLIVLILIAIFTVGCVTTNYKMGDKTFHSSSEALTEQNKSLSNELAGITPTNAPIHGTILVLLPSDVEIRKNYIRFTGNPSNISEDVMKYIVVATKINFQFVADAIRKRGIFDTVSVAYQNGNPAPFPIGEYDYLAFVDVDGWFLRGRDKPKPLLVATLNDKHKLLIESLEQQARSLRGN
jgi:hypothetical protein